MKQLTKKQKRIIGSIVIAVLLTFTAIGGYVFYNTQHQVQVAEKTNVVEKKVDDTKQPQETKVEQPQGEPTNKAASNNDTAPTSGATPKPAPSAPAPQPVVKPAPAPAAQPAPSAPAPQPVVQPAPKPAHEPHFVGSQTTIGYCPITIGANMNYEAESCFESVIPNLPSDVGPGWTIGVGYMIHNPSDNEDYMIDENTNRVYTEHGYMCLDC